jgi:hypothetical protein
VDLARLALADLIGRRNAIDAEIAAAIGRHAFAGLAGQLRQAVERQDLAAIRSLLREDADLWDMSEGVDRAPFHLALKSPNPELRALFEREQERRSKADNAKARDAVRKSLRPATDLRAIFERTRRAEAFVVAFGQYSPSPPTGERAIVLAVRANRAKRLADLWLARSEVAVFLAGWTAGAKAYMGACDAMARTRPRYAWAMMDHELRVWRGRRLIAVATSEELRLLRLLRRPRRIASSRIVAVRAYAGIAWISRGVRLRLAKGWRVTIARRFEIIGPLIDATYDSLDLACDAAWCIELGSALAKALGASFEKDRCL